MNESTCLLEPKNNRVFIHAIMAAFGGFVCGYDTGSISSIIALPLFQKYFYKSTYSIAYYESLLLTFYLITSMIGAFASGYFCGKS
jgi:hypothetical protein